MEQSADATAAGNGGCGGGTHHMEARIYSTVMPGPIINRLPACQAACSAHS